MPSIDERVVSMAFENQVFEQRVAQTMGTLGKLDTAIKNVGSTSGLENIEKSADKVTLQGPMSALDKLRAKLSGAGNGAAQGFSDIDKAGNKVTLEGPARAADKVQGKLDNLSAGSTFSDIEKASNQVELGGLTRALDVVTNKFSVLEGAAAVALGGIAQQAISKGANFAKSFGVGPIMDGLHEYETNLKAIQTVQANTDQPLTKINQSLNDLNRYSDQTIYNFGEMAKNIGTFTAAGVDLKTATSSIKGIANMAALSGSSSQQAATAMYQLSQAISSGRVGLQDWNSVVNAGMGGKKLQSALVTTGIAMGDVSKNALKFEGPMKKLTINGKSFRESIMAQPGKQSWLSSDILVNTLATLDGRFSKAALSAELTKNGLKKYSAAQVEASIADSRAALEKKNGVKYTDEQFKALQKLSDSAFKSATEVKTLGQVFDVAKETIGSGWSATFQNIFGNLKEAKATFTELSGAINGFINKTSLARNELLAGWKEMGGRTAAIQGIKNIFNVLFDVLGKVGQAFREIFPKKTSQDLVDLTNSFLVFTAHLNNSPEIIDNIARTFKGFFAVIHIGWSIVKGLIGVIFDLLGVVGKGSGSFLNFTGGIGDFLVAVDDALTKGGLLKGFFSGLTSVLAAPLRVLRNVVGAIAGLFGGEEDVKRISTRTGKVVEFGKSLSPVEKLINTVKTAWDNLTDAFAQTKDAVEPFLSSFVDKLKGLGDIIANAFSGLDIEKVMSGLQTGFIAGIFLVLKNAFGKKGPLASISTTLGGVNKLLGSFTGQMEAMQSKLHAEALLAIAGAIAVLAAGLFVLSTIPGDKLTKALSASAVGLGELMGAMKLMTAGMGKMGILQLPVIAAGLIGLAVAVLLLSAAMKVFATMSWEDIGKGLAGVAGSLTAIGVGMKMMPPTLPLTAAGLILIGVALNLIAAAIGQFGQMKWEAIGKGLFAVADSLGLIALGVSMMPPNMPLMAAGLILMGIALSFIGGAIQKMGKLDFATILKGLGTMLFALVAIGEAMWLMPPNLPLTAAGLILVGVALNAIGTAIAIMGKIGVFGIVKGLIALAGALTILSVGLYLMEGTLPGAVALAAAAVALAILAPTLAFLGTLKFSTIFKGLAAIALVLGTLALVGALAASPLAALGVAMLPLAAVFVLTAGAVFLFAKALSLLGGEGGKGIAVMVTALTAFVALIPKLVLDFVKGLVDIVSQVAVLAPKVITALGVIIDMIIAFVIANAPRLAIAIGVLVDSILQVLLENVPKLISAGVKLLSALLSGISQNITQVTMKVTEIVLKFLAAMAQQAPKLAAGGLKVLVSFLGGIASNIGKVVAQVASMITKFLAAVATHIPKIMAAGVTVVVKFLAGIAQGIPRFVAAGVKIITSFMQGVGEAIPKLVKKGLWLAKQFLTGISDGLVGLADIGFKAIIRFLNGMADTIRKNSDDLAKAGANLADAIIDGLVDQFGKLGGVLRTALTKVFGLLPGWAKKILGISSPSKVFMEIGKFTMLGFAKGVDDNKHQVKKAASGSAEDMIGQIKNVLGIHSPSAVMEAIGADTMKGFANGLRGSQSDIRNAFRDLNEKLTTAMKDARSAIQENQKTLDEERAKAQPDAQAILAAEAAIAKNEQVLRRATAAHQSLVSSLTIQKKQLIGLTKDYQVVVKGLDLARQALDDAKRARDDAKKSLTDKFDTTPTIDQESENQVRTYVEALQEQITATKSYTETLAKLRALGLDDKTYQKLLDEGLAGRDFAESLLAGGQGAVDSLNKLDAELLAASTTLAKNASTALYQAGVDAAQGLVNGLKTKKAELAKQMDDLAQSLVNAIKRRLKIKSPSQIFVEMGRLTLDGLTKGLRDGGAGAQKVMESTAQNLVDATKSALGKVPSMLSGIIDMDPTITPVLDLSNVEKGAQKLGDLTNVVPITAAASFGQASATSQEVSAAVQAASEASAAGQPSVMFEQNNYSPEALSDVEIYRQTKNQLGQLKGALGLPN